MLATIIFENLINKIINLEHIPIELLTFLYAVKRVLKVIKDVWTVEREPHCFFVRGVTHVKSISFC
jgi:hypothetical protein